jgi:hypothetical protein
MSHNRPHQVYMSFFLMEGWQVQFLSHDLKTALPSKLTFADPEKIRELAKQGDATGTPESSQMLEDSIQAGRGGVYLKLTRRQFRDLAEKLSLPANDLRILVRSIE